MVGRWVSGEGGWKRRGGEGAGGRERRWRGESEGARPSCKVCFCLVLRLIVLL